ncbi:hypothetical protein [Agrobacterium vitis]|uniref:HAD family hydrolase n=1 Tax=Agrobacterium vitis TaxID=373 RepID=A0AAE2RDG4_AGRVI|nr:hypothetical protein [Agrobacterium vitis]MBF2716438.1 hypothetical protein [Agrobacterium vitis]MVA21274.1 hypothetical protein [Agrobacterium vitis]
MGEIVDFNHVRLADRPLLISDVDDVVLEFLVPFEAYLDSLGHRLLPKSFRLHGNIVSAKDQLALEDQIVTDLLLTFFEKQEEWQTPFGDAVAVLQRIGKIADIVFLTAMPPAFTAQRRRLLDRLGLDFPLLATESPKGPVVKALHGDRPLPFAFMDDMAHNLHSVGEHAPDCLLVQIGPQSEIHRHAPPPGPHVLRAGDWHDASERVLRHFQARV